MLYLLSAIHGRSSSVVLHLCQVNCNRLGITTCMEAVNLVIAKPGYILTMCKSVFEHCLPAIIMAVSLCTISLDK